MRYNKVKNANLVISTSDYLVSNPTMHKNNWNKVFDNNNPICLELGMGRGSFIIEMANLDPSIN